MSDFSSRKVRNSQERRSGDECGAHKTIPKSITPLKRKRSDIARASEYCTQELDCEDLIADGSGAPPSWLADATQSCRQQNSTAEEDKYESPLEKKAGRRVSFAAGPLDSNYSERVALDGHPDHEGETACRRRVLETANYSCEPITKYSIRLLEVELGAEYSPSLTRLKRRFGLIPTAQRNLPYLTASQAQQREGVEQGTEAEEGPEAEKGPPLMDMVPRTTRGPGPNCQPRLSTPKPGLSNRSQERSRRYDEGRSQGFAGFMQPLGVVRSPPRGISGTAAT